MNKTSTLLETRRPVACWAYLNMAGTPLQCASALDVGGGRPSVSLDELLACSAGGPHCVCACVLLYFIKPILGNHYSQGVSSRAS